MIGRVLQTIATVSLFLGCKIEDTRCMLGDVVVMSYDIIYKWDPSAPQRIRQRRVSIHACALSSLPDIVSLAHAPSSPCRMFTLSKRN